MNTMTDTDREKINLASLTEIEPVIAGRRMNPFSAGRLQLCRQVGLKIVSGNAKDLEQSALEMELLAFYFIHAFPLAEVREACVLSREEFFVRKIDPLSFEFPAREMPKILTFIEREFTGIEAANVDVEKKPGPSGPPAPPN